MFWLFLHFEFDNLNIIKILLGGPRVFVYTMGLCWIMLYIMHIVCNFIKSYVCPLIELFCIYCFIIQYCIYNQHILSSFLVRILFKNANVTLNKDFFGNFPEKNVIDNINMIFHIRYFYILFLRTKLQIHIQYIYMVFIF